jgi:hypothetical protein
MSAAYDTPRHAGLRPERILLHPLWLASLLLLIANDHVFKGAGILHHVATGKLSDFVGLLVAPALLGVLVFARSRAAIAACHVATGVVFALTEISPACARALEQAMTVAGVPWVLTPDLTDLLALPMLAVSWLVLVPAMERPVVRRERAAELGRMAAATVGFLACVGTSQVKEPPVAAPPTAPNEALVAETPPSRGLADLLGSSWRAKNQDGTWQLTYAFASDGGYTATGQPTFQETGRVELVSASGNVLNVRFVDRRFEGQSDEPADRTLTLAADGASFTMGNDRYERVGAATLAGPGVAE